MVDSVNYVIVPESREECTSMIESFKNNGPLAVMIYMNYLYNQIKSLEERKSKIGFGQWLPL